MSKDKKIKKIKVIGYKVFIHPHYPLPSLRCELENGKFFDMGAIPFDAAIAIERFANGVDITSDPRMVLALILAEIPSVEGALRGAVEEVVIDDILRHTGGYVYCANVKIKINGKTIRRVMVPSSAIVLALLSGADVYVNEKFVSTFVEEV
ncbi:MAG: hypothetical protein DRJ20_01895 [Candidatus Methanomethylicota archaeon]|uniref:BFN domain-containing protein n=1 Tax=Thermoproteota archaeon TaxID=2056631 RepID=A0A497EWK5_9CREN|nr:MAG: hypothetical protein DRJ20_01895 [Candidatus Verstraetearchaeota archaeon]